jgi:hypothetical protein
VNDPAIFFRPIGGFGAPDRRLYASACQSLSNPFVEEPGLDFVSKLGGEPKAVSARTARTEDLSARRPVEWTSAVDRR